MLPANFLQVLKYEGVVAIATQGANGRSHLVNTWNSYVQVTPDDLLLIPVGGMHTTERNVLHNNGILLTAGSRDVEGKHGPGTGFLVSGPAEFSYAGPEFDLIKRRFSWARAALKVTVKEITQIACRTEKHF